MLLETIKTKQYKPLKHGGISEIEIKTNSPVVCLIGQNGSGKSTLLKEMSPYPSTRTDFDEFGLSYLEISHEGSNYRISSNFSLSSGAHSFIKDEEELNESGTTGTQTQLCELHLGMSTLIKNIMFGDIQISSMSKSDRKKLLLACYPTDLSFILKHHKSICSKIRAVKSNLKLMNVKKLEINDKMIGEIEYADLVKLSDDINDFRIDVDKWIHSLTIEINEWNSNEIYTSRIGLDNTINHNSLKSELKYLHDKNIANRYSNREIYEGITSSKLELVCNDITYNNNDILNLNTQINSLVEEINNIEAIVGKNTTDEIKQITDDLIELRKFNLPIDTKLPRISKQDIERFPLSKLQEGLSFIGNFENEILSEEVIFNIELEISDYKNSLVILQSDLGRIDEIIQRTSTRLNRETSSSYNPKCVMVCPLKTNYNSVISDIDNELKNSIETKKKCEEDIISITNKYDKLIKKIEGQDKTLIIIKYLKDLLYHFPWFEVTLNNNNLVSVLNENPSSIYNSINRIIDNGNKLVEIQNNNSKIDRLEIKLNSLTNTKAPTKEFINNALVTKKAQLKELSDVYMNAQNKKDNLDEKEKYYSELFEDKTNITNINNEFISKANYQLIKGKIDILDYIVEHLKKYRTGADEKQAEIKNTVREQQAYRTSLNDTILPTISELNNRLVKLEQLECALSPNSGFPHIYMIRFINSLIMAANEFIKIVWNYDMEIVHLKENSVLDFTLAVKINKNTVVKDISICSKGQQEIINLAWILALCNEMGLGQNYPLILDEPDSGLSNGHRENLLTLLNTLMRQGNIKQLILVNHFSSLFTAFAHNQIICLADDGIVTPTNVNEGVVIKRINV